MRRRIPTLGAVGALVLIGAGVSIPAELAAREAQTIPASMLGTWGWEPASCANPADDGRLIVNARSLEFHASLFELQNVAVEPEGSVRANATYREEGEEGTSRAVVRLRIVAPGSLLVQTCNDDGHVYVRCGSSN